MTVLEGFPGVSNTVKFSYRGHAITRRYRLHDSRNKTHRGYWWNVEFADGKTIHGLGTRKSAKAAIDQYEEAVAKAG